MKFIILSILLVLIFFNTNLFPNMIISSGNYDIKIFKTETDIEGWKGKIKGNVISFSSRETLDKNDFSGIKHSKTRINVRLYNIEGLKKGDILYIINRRNLIVSKLKISTFYKSQSFGYILIGHGNFILANLDDRVVQKTVDENSKYAYIHKSRGDYFVSLKENGKAIAEYKKAIKLDRGNPEAHFSLGEVYFNQELYQFAFREYSEAYKHINRLYDNEDKYQLLKQMAIIRYSEVNNSYLPGKIKNRFRSEGMKYCREALRIYPKSVDMNFRLGMFYYNNPNDYDKMARDYFLKVIKVNPDHIRANITLSELYFKHKNTGKAKKFAARVINIDPKNRRAKKLLDYYTNFNK